MPPSKAELLEAGLEAPSQKEIDKTLAEWRGKDTSIQSIKQQIQRWQENRLSDVQNKFPKKIATYEAALAVYEKTKEDAWLEEAIRQQREGQSGNDMAGAHGSPRAQAASFGQLSFAHKGSTLGSRQVQMSKDRKAGISSGDTSRSATPPAGFRRPMSSRPRKDTSVYYDLPDQLNRQSPSSETSLERSGARASAPVRQSSRLARSETAAPRATTAPHQAGKRSEGPIDISSDEEVEALDTREAAAAAQVPPRRTTRSTAYRSTSARFEGLKALYPPEGGKDSVQLVASDLSRLDPEEFLNDTVIDYFIKRIQVEMEEGEPGSSAQMLFFNSFFFKKLTERPTDDNATCSRHEQNHERVRNWTKGKDIFDKNFLFIPIHDHLHWSLLIVCFPSSFITKDGRHTSMLLLDSMDGGHSVQSVAGPMRGYLAQEWKRKVTEHGSVAWRWRQEHPNAPLPDFSAKNLPSRKPSHLPRQDNYCDCGLFTLTYIHFFSFANPKRVNPDSLADLSDEHDGYPLLLSRLWFTKENAGHLRQFLRRSILLLFISQATDPEAPEVLEAIAEAESLKAVAFKYQSPQASLTENERKRRWQQEDAQRRAEREAARKAEKDAAALRDAQANEKAAEAAQLRAGRNANGACEDIEVVLDGKESSPEEAGNYLVNGEWTRKKRGSAEGSSRQSPCKQRKLDSYMTGNQLGSGQPVRELLEISAKLARVFELSSEMAPSEASEGVVQFCVRYKRRLTRNELGQERKFKSVEGAMAFMESELENHPSGWREEDDSPRIVAESRQQKSDLRRAYITDDEDAELPKASADPPAATRGRGRVTSHFSEGALLQFRKTQKAREEGSKQRQRGQHSSGCREEGFLTLDSEDDEPDDHSGDRQRQNGAANAAQRAPSTTGRLVRKQDKGLVQEVGKAVSGGWSALMSGLKDTVSDGCRRLSAGRITSVAPEAISPSILTQVPDSPPSAERIPGGNEDDEVGQVTDKCPVWAKRGSAMLTQVAGQPEEEQPLDSRRAQGNFAQYQEQPGRAPEAILEATATYRTSLSAARDDAYGLQLVGEYASDPDEPTHAADRCSKHRLASEGLAADRGEPSTAAACPGADDTSRTVSILLAEKPEGLPAVASKRPEATPVHAAAKATSGGVKQSTSNDWPSTPGAWQAGTPESHTSLAAKVQVANMGLGEKQPSCQRLKLNTNLTKQLRRYVGEFQGRQYPPKSPPVVVPPASPFRPEAGAQPPEPLASLESNTFRLGSLSLDRRPSAGSPTAADPKPTSEADFSPGGSGKSRSRNKKRKL